MITVVAFFRFRPLSQNQKEQQTVTSSKPKSGATSASRLSRKTWKEDGKNCSIFSIHRFIFENGRENVFDWSDANTSVNAVISFILLLVTDWVEYGLLGITAILLPWERFSLSRRHAWRFSPIAAIGENRQVYPVRRLRFSPIAAIGV